MPDRGDPARFDTRTVDAALRWAAPDDGLYQVAVNDLYGSQRGRPPALVPAEHPARAARLPPLRRARRARTCPTPLTVPAGGRASASVLAWRLDGFTGPIRVEAVDLPAGRPLRAGRDRRRPVDGAGRLRGRRGRPARVGTVRLVGRGRFGDRKERPRLRLRGRPRSAPTSRTRRVGGGIVWPLVVTPQQQQNPPTAPARLTRGFVLRCVDAAPLTLTARAASATVDAGRHARRST